MIEIEIFFVLETKPHNFKNENKSDQTKAKARQAQATWDESKNGLNTRSQSWHKDSLFENIHLMSYIWASSKIVFHDFFGNVRDQGHQELGEVHAKSLEDLARSVFKSIKS